MFYYIKEIVSKFRLKAVFLIHHYTAGCTKGHLDAVCGVVKPLTELYVWYIEK